MQVECGNESKDGNTWMANTVSNVTQNSVYVVIRCQADYADKSNNADVWKMLESGSVS